VDRHLQALWARGLTQEFFVRRVLWRKDKSRRAVSPAFLPACAPGSGTARRGHSHAATHLAGITTKVEVDAADEVQAMHELDVSNSHVHRQTGPAPIALSHSRYDSAATR